MGAVAVRLPDSYGQLLKTERRCEMEFIMGSVFLFQLLIFVQLIRAKRQLLREIRKQSEKIEVINRDIEKKMTELGEMGVPKAQNTIREIQDRIPAHTVQEPSFDGGKESEGAAQEQEALINEVLSEVFT